MACINNCGECESCNPNPCYDDCGCLNPTTFECITNPGLHSALGITNDMNGVQVLEQINAIINSLTIEPPAPGSDVYVKVSNSDTTSDYLNNKLLVGTYLIKTILSAGANEKIRIDANLAAMISSDIGNELEIGTDNKLRVIPNYPEIITYLVEGSGVTITGAGTTGDPYVISTNPSISAARSCFDGVWRDVTIVATGNPDVLFVSGQPRYRIRHDGSIEFKGSITYTVNFGQYSTANRKRVVTIGNIPVSCLTVGEQAGVADLKSITYIDQPGVGDQITQMYGYIVRKSSQNIIIEFQSSYIANTSKTIVINFDGVISHPNI